MSELVTKRFVKACACCIYMISGTNNPYGYGNLCKGTDATNAHVDIDTVTKAIEVILDGGIIKTYDGLILPMIADCTVMGTDVCGNHVMMAVDWAHQYIRNVRR
jgi:hypothetical protein